MAAAQSVPLSNAADGRPPGVRMSRAVQRGLDTVAVGVVAERGDGVDRGRIEAGSVPELDPAGLTTETASPAGRIGHLKPVVQLSETPPYWARPPVPLGYHRPEWP